MSRLVVWPVVAVSGVLGFITGAFLEPSWQDVIEPAQVLAGLVTYPAGNPVYLYSTATYTVLHQIVAVVLALGVAEHGVAIVTSGLIGALSFVALGLTTRALGAPWYVAAVAPLFIQVSGASRFSPGYPVLLLGWPYTYGLISHALLLLVIALIGLRRDRLAAVTLGVFPAIHPAVGVWAWCIAGSLALILRSELMSRVRAVSRWFAAGVAIAIASWSIHFLFFYPELSAMPAAPPELLAAVRRYWDVHRQPLDWTDQSVAAALLVPLAFTWWQGRRRTLPDGSRAIAVGMLVAALIALGADVLIRLAPDVWATRMAQPMPTRLLALPLMGAMAWIIGVATGPAVRPFERTLASVILAGLVIAVTPAPGGVKIAELLLPETAARIAVMGTPALVPLGIAALAVIAASTVTPRFRLWLEQRAQRLALHALAAALTLLAGLQTTSAIVVGRDAMAAVRDRHNDSVLSATATRPGLLVTGPDLHLIQAATRRPVLIDPGALDALVYVPAASVISEHILQRVYGVSLLRPLDSGSILGTLPLESHSPVWPQRSLAEWQDIAREFGITDILTSTSATLQLPVVASNDLFTLWTIPVR